MNGDYWRKVLLNWEKKRYGILSIINPFTIPLKKRMKISKRLIEESPKDMRGIIIELGCGTGLMAQKLKKINDIQYTGYDISDEGIEIAKERKLGENFHFISMDINLLGTVSSDIVLLLGLTDWLNFQQNVDLLKKIKASTIIWSYTLKKPKRKISGFYGLFDLFRNRKNNIKTLSFTANERDKLFQIAGGIELKKEYRCTFGPARVCVLSKK